MTNLIAQLTISLVLVTNWTDIIRQGQQAGLICTNHVATIEYLGTTNSMTLKIDYANWLAWRTNAQPEYYYHYATNYCFTNNRWMPGNSITNKTDRRGITNLMWDTKNANKP